MVFCSNVTSFIDDKEKAINEYIRLTKPNGFVSAVPIYYAKKPPKNIVENVSNEIGTEIKIWDKKFWLDKFSHESI